MTHEELKRLAEIMFTIAGMPDMGYQVNKRFPTPGIIGCSIISSHLNDIASKLIDTGTPEQIEKLKKLSEAYKMVSQDLNEVYLIYAMYCNERNKLIEERQRNKFLIEENEKLKKSINFDG